MEELQYLETDYDRAEYLQSLLVDHATGGEGNDTLYQELRGYFLDAPATRDFVPRWVRVNRNLSQFWQFIKHEFETYAERRRFIWNEFSSLLECLEAKQRLPPGRSISEVLQRFDADGIHFAWQKALERKANDPEGAITISRTILESVCKHILDDQGIEYDANKIELHQLYKRTANELNLSPEQHSEKVFKQILGGCSAIVNGLGSLRNRLGDAHGKGKRKVKPASRHAELAVNLAGAMALFLIETYNARKS